MKFLLMVERSGRVVCAGECHNGGTGGSAQKHHFDLGSSMYGTYNVGRALHSSRRWWLVECDNAEDARTVILQERALPAGIVSTLGRVLESSAK